MNSEHGIGNEILANKEQNRLVELRIIERIDRRTSLGNFDFYHVMEIPEEVLDKIESDDDRKAIAAVIQYIGNANTEEPIAHGNERELHEALEDDEEYENRKKIVIKILDKMGYAVIFAYEEDANGEKDEEE
jgi:hypothetical protein